MTDKIDNGGPAFPSKHVYRDSQGIDHEISALGMTMRDWFAGQALAGANFEDWLGYNSLARNCYQIADAMIAARKGPTNDH